MHPDLALELPLSQTYFRGSKDVRAIEVLLYKCMYVCACVHVYA